MAIEAKAFMKQIIALHIKQWMWLPIHAMKLISGSGSYW